MKHSFALVFSFLVWVFCYGWITSSANLSAWEVLGTHITLLLRQDQYVSSSTSNFSDVLSFQKALQSQLSYNLVSVLDTSASESSKRLVVRSYLSESESLLFHLQKFVSEEERLIEQYSQEIQRCEAPILQYNSEFSLAVKNFEYAKAHGLSQRIAEARSCVARYTVYAKERILYKTLLLSWEATLRKRVAYIKNNQEQIVKYYSLLKPQLLKELHDISNVLQVNFSG